jgi:hypothetical protein
MRTERVAAAFEAGRQQGISKFTESPEYEGRAVLALAAGQNIFQKFARALAVGDLAEE